MPSYTRRVGETIIAGLLCITAACTSIPGKPPVVAKCSTPSDGDRPGRALVGQTYGMQMTALPLNSVQFDSAETARRVAVQGLFANRTAAGTVQVTARLLACEDKSSTVRIRTSFLKKDTSPAEAESSWRTVYLTPKGLSIYEEKSTSTDVANYLIHVAASPR